MNFFHWVIRNSKKLQLHNILLITPECYPVRRSCFWLIQYLTATLVVVYAQKSVKM